MRVAVVTSCTNRKKLTPCAELQARSLPRAPLNSLAKEWTRRSASAPAQVTARNLYAGRAITEALGAATIGGGGCYIVSAGLGLINVEQAAPSYSLTVAGKHGDNVLGKATDGPCNPTEWWFALNETLGFDRPLASLIERNSACVIVLALPSTYLSLVAKDLASVSPAALPRLRILGLPSTSKTLPDLLSKAFVPYDERLESIHGHAGTRSDFPQRAARHFIGSLLSRPGAALESSEQHAALVLRCLSEFDRPVIPDRKRCSDEMLKDVIRKMWDESNGSVTSGLKLLRNKRKIACEQARFKRLFWEVAEQKYAAS
jgi:hypothetical protein